MTQRQPKTETQNFNKPEKIATGFGFALIAAGVLSLQTPESAAEHPVANNPEVTSDFPAEWMPRPVREDTHSIEIEYAPEAVTIIDVHK